MRPTLATHTRAAHGGGLARTITTTALATAAAALVTVAGCAGIGARPSVPAAIATAASQPLVLSVAARGVQIYECRSGGDGRARWRFVAPDAELFDAGGRRVGHHGAGPVWAFDDGTRITARLAAQADAPRPDAIAWLLLQADTHAGRDARLADVRSIQRIHTTGGRAPAADCPAGEQGRQVRVPYTADYLFYGAAARSAGRDVDTSLS